MMRLVRHTHMRLKKEADHADVRKATLPVLSTVDVDDRSADVVDILNKHQTLATVALDLQRHCVFNPPPTSCAAPLEE